MTELTMQLIKDVNRAVIGHNPLTVLDLLNIDHPNLVVKVSEVSFKDKIFYRHYWTMFESAYICLLPDDGSITEFEPIAHLDDIVSGRVEFESFEIPISKSDDPEKYEAYTLLPRVFTPEFMVEDVEREHKIKREELLWNYAKKNGLPQEK